MSDEAREAVETIRENYAEWCSEGMDSARGATLARERAYASFDAMIQGVRAEGIRQAREAVAAGLSDKHLASCGSLLAIDALVEADHDVRTDQPWDLGGDRE